MEQVIGIEGHPNLQRDPRSKAILNTDRSELSRYKQQSNMLERNRNLAEDVDVLKQDMAEIKNLLRQLTAR